MGPSEQQAKHISKSYIQDHDDWLHLEEVIGVAREGDVTYVRTEVKVSELLGYTEVILTIDSDGTIVGEEIFAKPGENHQ